MRDTVWQEWCNRPPHLMQLSLEEYKAQKEDKVVRPTPAVLPAKGKATPSHTWGEMNKLEGSYANHLELRKLTGEIVKWRFEAVRFRLAPNTTYTPDFQLVFPDGRIEFHETKGFWRQTGRVKIKVAASMFPEFRFVAVQWNKKT